MWASHWRELTEWASGNLFKRGGVNRTIDVSPSPTLSSPLLSDRSNYFLSHQFLMVEWWSRCWIDDATKEGLSDRHVLRGVYWPVYWSVGIDRWPLIGMYCMGCVDHCIARWVLPVLISGIDQRVLIGKYWLVSILSGMYCSGLCRSVYWSVGIDQQVFISGHWYQSVCTDQWHWSPSIDRWLLISRYRSVGIDCSMDIFRLVLIDGY